MAPAPNLNSACTLRALCTQTPLIVNTLALCLADAQAVRAHEAAIARDRSAPLGTERVNIARASSHCGAGAWMDGGVDALRLGGVVGCICQSSRPRKPALESQTSASNSVRPRTSTPHLICMLLLLLLRKEHLRHHRHRATHFRPSCCCGRQRLIEWTAQLASEKSSSLFDYPNAANLGRSLLEALMRGAEAVAAYTLAMLSASTYSALGAVTWRR